MAIGLLYPAFFAGTKKLVSTIDFHTALMKVMLSFLLLALAMPKNHQIYLEKKHEKVSPKISTLIKI
jgi:hypothetical protein